MPEFNVPADIGNRALQHLGQRQMAAALGFNEPSKNATEISFAYGKMRQAELERNSWRFAIRRQVLRAVDQNAMLLAPALFSATVTYFQGSIVADQNGTLWISNRRNNVGNDPQTTTAWDPYFGPMMAALYDPTQAYFAGEVVYTAPGDGTYNAYLSLVSGNTVDPSLPSVWYAQATYFQNQVVQAFPAWSSGATYVPGQTVTYTDGNTYTSLTGGNINNIPPNTLGSAWTLTPILQLGPSSVAGATTPAAGQAQGNQPQTSPVAEWAYATTYSIGNFVMFGGNEYVSLQNNNTSNTPNAAGSGYWAQVTGGTLWMSLIDLNANNNPSNTPGVWTAGITYASGALVSASDGLVYESLQNANTGNQPASGEGPTWWLATGTAVPWTTSFTLGGGNSQWLQIGGAAAPAGVSLVPPNIRYPLGTGPATDFSTANIFRLPAAFLRRAPLDPKAGATSDLGAPTELTYDDYLFEGAYLLSRAFGPVVLRFVADVQDVSKMDALFCECVAAAIAVATCETLTGSTEKMQVARLAYADAHTKAALQNAILIGSDEPPMDDWQAVRY